MPCAGWPGRRPRTARPKWSRWSPVPWWPTTPGRSRSLATRRAETEEGRHQPEDWPGHPDRPRLGLRVANPLDLAAAVAGAEAVVARTGAMMALAWALGTPHVAVAGEDSPPSHFAAWTGDASALVHDGAELVATLDNIFARRGRPPGLRRLEATLDQSLDDAAANLEKTVAATGPGGPETAMSAAAWQERAQELEAVNDALRQRLATERLRFGERSALLENAANTSVESAIKAVHGQDVIVRRRLEQTEKEMRRLQEETARQQAELRAIHASLTMRALARPEPGTSGSGGRRTERSRPAGHHQGRPQGTLAGELASWLADQGGPAPAGGPAVAVLAAGDEGIFAEEVLVELLSGPLGIGAVVPLLYGLQGQVLEAGSFVGPSGAVAPFGSHMAVGARPGFPARRPRQRLERDRRLGPRPGGLHARPGRHRPGGHGARSARSRPWPGPAYRLRAQPGGPRRRRVPARTGPGGAAAVGRT